MFLRYESDYLDNEHQSCVESCRAIGRNQALWSIIVQLAYMSLIVMAEMSAYDNRIKPGS